MPSTSRPTPGTMTRPGPHAWTPDVRDAGAPLYAAIVDALAHDVGRGALAPGQRLPTHRELARALGTSTGTITRAYIEAERRGLIHGRVGRGTFVRDLTDRGAYSPRVNPGRIDLGPMAVPAVPGDVGHAMLSAALSRLGARADLVALSGYQEHGGTAEQRRAGARWLALCGVPAAEHEVTVCAGAQHATAILLSALATDAGVLMEELTHAGALEAVKHLRIPAHPVTMDGDGLIPEALDAAAVRTGATVLYCTPTNHNPTGIVAPAARRVEIVRVCRARGITLIENGALSPLAAAAPPPLAALAPERTCYIGTLSKAALPALRIGFIRTPPELADRVELGVSATMWSVSPLLAEIAATWIGDGTAEALRDARRAEAAARWRIAARVLDGHGVTGGTSYLLWLPIPVDRSALEVVEQAAARDVMIGPAHLFAVRPGSAPNAVRLSLGAPGSREELEEGLRIIAGILAGDGPRRRSL
ncbi:PLP-dependent aminotransferase family protein [Longimicrobium sp.]|uniref:aminotransferase-like domain-containing protein n=1 Tax=Longimicrobium sp. TaxID=2029185 RepID=UPI002E2EE35A|nr:PLP-dependent aminotransferase family protein [Longimicrobium sp.]HEX6036546.1 PLP-dependent aminotransferase family protein [Longimicrobium sp.]